METDCLPHIISGTSAGSAVGALVCTRTNEVCKNDAWLLQWDRLWLDIVESF
jgi:predicted acylesterase/phospholipase RssA